MSVTSASFCSELFPVGVWKEHTDGSADRSGWLGGREACGVRAWLPSWGGPAIIIIMETSTTSRALGLLVLILPSCHLQPLAVLFLWKSPPPLAAASTCSLLGLPLPLWRLHFPLLHLPLPARDFP
ncbi:hypothetical protein HJG60_007899 [Phyllostomus discolor]|uniref:Uncharacterized protein n=1 Tax=Phyllostomus discolor TaxID=89673 RepID=A0A834EVM4_9CHIR|nr:hypothetical protein HJG60_007899 [Phyllostomus discolor]